MTNLLLVILGGSLGAVARYGVNLLSVRVAGGGFPWGTLAVNLLGCFLIGLSFGWAERFAWWTPTVRLFFVTGFLGALTTFSSFAAETMNTDSLYVAGTNILVNNVGGLVLVLVGMWVAKIN